MRDTVPFLLRTVSISPGPWWLNPLWSFRQHVEVRSTFSDETGARHVRSRAASSHLECCTVIDADTMANASYEAKRPWRPVRTYPSSHPWQLCSLRISMTR